MATWLKSANFSGYNGSHFYIDFYYDVLSQSKVNNTSTVRYYLYFSSSNGYSAYGATASGIINGNVVGYVSSIGANSTIFLGQFDTTITHDANGNATANYSASLSTSWSGVGSAAVSGSFALPKIDRFPQILTAPNFNDEDDPTITYSTTLGFENAIVEACISLDRTAADVPYREVVVEDGQYTFELTNAERETLRNATTTSNSRTIIFFLRTKVPKTGGGYDMYFSTVERTLSIVNANPTFTHNELETNQNVINILGSSASSIIENASVVQMTITPTALKGASISSVRVSSGLDYSQTITTSPYVFTIPITVSSFVINVIDSRGNSSGTAVQKTLIPYTPVRLNTFTFVRENPTSSNIIVNVEGNYLQTNFENTANVPTIKWKLDDGNYTTIPSSNYVIDTTNNKITITDYELTNTLVYTSQGNFAIELSDLLTTATESDILVLKGIPTFDYGEHDLKVNGDLYVADINGENAKNVMELLEWQYLDEKTGTQAITLPSKFSELMCVVAINGDDTLQIPIIIPYNHLTTNTQSFNGGYYATSSLCGYARINATTTSANLSGSYVNGQTGSGSITYYYYR